MDLDNDGVYNDMIFSFAGIVEGWSNIIDKYQWILACEDLGSTDDIDYNDIVVGVRQGTSDKAFYSDVIVRPMAAGGVLPAYLMYTETDNPEAQDQYKHYSTYFVGPEIHAWLGQPDDKMYNTDEDYTVIDTDGRPDAEVKYSFDNGKNNNNAFSLAEMMGADSYSGLTYRFWVLVDPENLLKRDGLAPADNSREFKLFTNEKGEPYDKVDTEMGYKYQGKVQTVNYPGTKTNGNTSNTKSPLLICVGNDWEWPKERESILEVYPGFQKWMNNPNDYKADPSRPEFVPNKWYGVDDEGYMITGENAPNRGKVVKRITPNERE